MTGKSKRSLSKRKRMFFRLMLASMVYGAVELLSWSGLTLSQEEFSYEKIRERQHMIANGSSVSDGATESVHPYLGWTHNPQIAPDEVIFDRRIPVNHLGFQDSSASVNQRTPDKFIVAILGGSVAWQVSVAGEETLTSVLKSHPRLQDKEIVIVRLATAGYKQPQQVMALNYVSVLGGEFDAVINIDGYNEVALSSEENAKMGTSIAYPRAWHARVITAVDPQISHSASRLLHLRGKRQQMANDILESRLSWSPTANLVWLIRDQSAVSELTDLAIEVSRARTNSFVYHGPAADNEDQAAINQQIVDLWLRSSIQLHRSCNAGGILYLHVLQPNQYCSGSKQMSPEEISWAWQPGQAAGEAIREVYPLLIDQTQSLADEGVAFSDQSMLFEDITETIYIDPYCHYNEKGNVLLAEAVATELLKLLDKGRPQQTQYPEPKP